MSKCQADSYPCPCRDNRPTSLPIRLKEVAVRVDVQVTRDAQLFEVVDALRASCRLSGRLNRRHNSATRIPMMAITTSSSTNASGPPPTPPLPSPLNPRS